ncbi:signal transduction histidine kinase [Aquimarina sp. MAR_2010_214]|uniref:sensor histidine kinase n=1 Tax=Aquimarina sp. MAR_2010_214 TaxID=1250026 RepID=UPI000C711721|nr:HAMP domain-containing sensor histidine kinase [Aquimarina sp. MAR_2010_214]PKV52894.1 signal transduction histidine kinase [Aquimarina sp. MAR_2010_214]
MKLLILSNRYYFIGLLVISILGEILSYYMIKSIINREFNEQLFAEKEQLIYELREYDNLLETLYLNIGDRISLQKMDHDPKTETHIKDVKIYDFYKKEEISFRQIVFSDQVKDDFYIITISKSLLSSEDLIKLVTEIVALITFLFFMTMFLLSNIISKKVWKPFYDTLSLIKKLNIVKPQSFSFKKTKVREFRELNSTIETITNQMVKDYNNLKEYTENTSHEIQTPIAIIKNKIELIIQGNDFSKDQLIALNQIHKLIIRLSKLKDNLSLLSKISNNQFIDVVDINVADYLKEMIKSVEELIEMKNIDVSFYFKEAPIIRLNETLAYLLFINLISNAIKHNINHGKIILELTGDYVLIKNTGEPLPIAPEKLFERFKKHGDKHNSTGLGLSLIQSIVKYYNFSITYTNKEVWHILKLKF